MYALLCIYDVISNMTIITYKHNCIEVLLFDLSTLQKCKSHVKIPQNEDAGPGNNAAGLDYKFKPL